jgi:DDE superfamily endonuclease
MGNMIPSLTPIVAILAPTFTQPSAVTNGQLLRAWVMCLGRHTLRRAAENRHPNIVSDHSQRHGLDTIYNFFERSAWTPQGLARRVGMLILTRLKFWGAVTLLVDDTLAHKRGKSVWGLGWFRDAVASTKKRVATASGHNGVVLAVAVCVPFTKVPILALPLLARLHLPGQDQPNCVDLREMARTLKNWANLAA